MGHFCRCGEQFSEKRGWLRQCKAYQKIFVTVFLVLAIVCFSNKIISEIVQEWFLVEYDSSNWKRLRTTELDNCLDLCWQLWFFQDHRIKEHLNRSDIFGCLCDWCSSRWPRTMMIPSPSVIKEGWHFMYIATIWEYIWRVEAME